MPRQITITLSENAFNEIQNELTHRQIVARWMGGKLAPESGCDLFGSLFVGVIRDLDEARAIFESENIEEEP